MRSKKIYKPSPVFLLAIVAETAWFILDLFLPRGFSKWVVYFFPLLLIWNSSRKEVFTVVSIVSVFEMLGLIFSPAGTTPFLVAAMNRVSGIVIFWTVSILIISRIKAVKENRAQRQFLDTVLNNTTVRIAVFTGRDLKITYANKAFKDILGNEPFIGKLYREVFPDSAKSGTEHMIKNVIETGEPWILQRYNAPVPGKSDAAWEGQVVHLSASEVNPENSALSIVWEVTEWNRLEKQLRDREKRYSKLFNNKSIGIAHCCTITDSNGVPIDYEILEINEAYTKITGIKKEDIEGKRARKVFPGIENFSFDYIGNYGKVALEGDELNFEVFFEALQQWLSIYVYSPEKGEFIAIFTDISERKKAEIALRVSERQFRELADSMPQLVWTARPDGTVDYYNQKYSEFDGIMPATDGIWQWGPVVHQSDLKLTVGSWEHSVKTGDDYQVEHRIKHADGTYHWYLSRAIPVRGNQNTIVKWYGTATNIDAVKNAQLAVLESKNQLKILNENLETLVLQRTEQVRSLSTALTLAEQRERRRVSHALHDNLQQNLLAVRLLLGQHKRDHESDNLKKEDYDDVADSITILDKAIQTVKSLSIELNPPILGSQGLDAALQWLTQHMKKQYDMNIDLVLRGPISAIRNEIQLMLIQMVRELLYNVNNYSGVKNAVITAACENKKVRILVMDRGQGFDPDKVLHRPSDEKRLSLFTIRERLRLFNGDLSIRSTAGHGTTCEISLPVDIC